MSEAATTPAEGEALPDAEVAEAQTETEGQDQEAGQTEVEGEAPDETEQPDEDLEEVEWEGKKAKVPPEFKSALMRTADYTQKTQALAQERKTLETRQQEINREVEAQAALRDEYVGLAVKRASIAQLDVELEQYRNVDWDRVEQLDQANGTNEYQRHDRAYQRLQRARDQAFAEFQSAQGELDHKVKQRASESESARITRIREGYAKLPEVIPGWNPELEAKVAAFARSEGLSDADLQDAVATPNHIRLLHYARLGMEAEQQKKAAKNIKAAQQTQPVRTVGAGAPAARKTTDSSGDGLSTKEWMAREKARLEQRQRA